jgi:hypothetical protein
MMRRTPLLLLLLALAACTSPQPGTSNQPTATIPRQEFLLLEPFTLRIGTSLALKDSDLTISFVSVPSDQRCGSCTATGNAEVVLQLTMAGQPAKEIALQAWPVARTYADALPYTVHMLDLQPKRLYPPDSIDASHYEVSLLVEKPTITCRPQTGDSDGYLLKLCTYIQTRHVDVQPADPTQYRIKRVEERDDNGRQVVWVFLNCCGLGDIGVIDKVSGEVVGFRQGAR